MLLPFFCVLLVVSVYGQTCNSTTINWNQVIAVSKLVTTLQVVANPILNPETSPVAEKLWNLLAQINTNFIRYVPWFPYPKVGVAELDPPSRGETSWDFSQIEPQFRRFMAATYANGRSVIPNFSTQPTWMYATNDWSYPESPNGVAWGYPQGNAFPGTTELVAQYYGRLLSWIVLGEFTDEYGVVRRNTGQTYNLTHWEVFNEPEGCHGLGVEDYTVQFDAIVREIRRVVDPERNIKFVGLALSGREEDWITYFLNPNNHDENALPIDFISYHFYAYCSKRADPDTYTEFFSSADDFFVEARRIMNIKNSLSPNTKIDCDEIGIILPDDNDFVYQPFPNIYWNAAAAFYAYMFGNMAIIGYDVLGESQFAGVPVIPEWDINDAQFPGVSMTNWTTGEGTARFYVLQLLIDQFQPGDIFVNTSINYFPELEFCGVDVSLTGYVSLQCTDPNAVINKIQFAAYGTPSGYCHSYQHDPACDAKNTTDYVISACVGKNNCSILAYPTFGDPCFGTVKRLAIQASCTGNKGGVGHPFTAPVYVAAAIDGVTKKRKVLIVNKLNMPGCVNILGATGKVVYVLDETSGFGPAQSYTSSTDLISLKPFAVAIVRLD